MLHVLIEIDIILAFPISLFSKLIVLYFTNTAIKSGILNRVTIFKNPHIVEKYPYLASDKNLKFILRTEERNSFLPYGLYLYSKGKSIVWTF